MYRIVFLISCSWFLVSCTGKQKNSVLPYYNTPDFTPYFFTPQEASKKVTHTIADFSFTDQRGEMVTQNKIEGKIHVANFFFTACGSICPRMMNNLKETSDAYKTDSTVVFLSYSVTPWLDTVPKLKLYAENMSIDHAQWLLLTGNKAEIYKLARTSYFAEEDFGFSKDSTEFLHTEHILLIDKQKRIRGIYNGTLQLETQQLLKDIAALKTED